MATRPRLAGLVLVALALTAPTVAAIEPAFSSGNTRSASADDPRWNPHGPVAVVHEYVEADDAFPTNRRTVQRYKFSESGKLVELTRYYPDTERPISQSFTYDDEGRLTAWFARNADNNVLWGYRYRYNERGQLIQETEFGYNEHVVGHRAYLYHREDGMLRVEESAYDASGGVLWWMQRERSSHPDNESWSVYYPDGRVITTGTRTFDGHGNLVMEEEHDQISGHNSRTYYRYNPQGQVTLIEQFDRNDELQRHEEFQYDRHGNPTLHRIRMTSNGTYTTRFIQYDYDEYNNWVRNVQWTMRTEHAQLRVIEESVRIRRIEYRE